MKPTNKSTGSLFLIPASVFILLMLLLIIFIPRTDIHIWINSHHHTILDTAMKMWTWLGDGAVALFFVIPLLFIRLRYFFILMGSYAVSGILVQILKRTLFKGTPRPLKYFELNGIDYDLYIVPGVEPHSWNSFPSGHTATAFGVFFGLSLILRSKVLQFVCFILAVGVGYSRVYLSEHFLTDVVTGGVIGMVSAGLIWWWMNRVEKDWLDKPFHALLKK